MLGVNPGNQGPEQVHPQGPASASYPGSHRHPQMGPRVVACGPSPAGPPDSAELRPPGLLLRPMPRGCLCAQQGVWPLHIYFSPRSLLSQESWNASSRRAAADLNTDGRTTYTQAHPSGGKGRPVQILKLAEKAGHREAVLSSRRRGVDWVCGPLRLQQCVVHVCPSPSGVRPNSQPLHRCAKVLRESGRGGGAAADGGSAPATPRISRLDIFSCSSSLTG